MTAGDGVSSAGGEGSGSSFEEQFNNFSGKAMMENAQVMAALVALSGLGPGSGASPQQVINAGWEAMTSSQREEIASTVMLPAFMASSAGGGEGSIDGGMFAAIVNSGAPARALPAPSGNLIVAAVRRAPNSSRRSSSKAIS